MGPTLQSDNLPNKTVTHPELGSQFDLSEFLGGIRASNLTNDFVIQFAISVERAASSAFRFGMSAISFPARSSPTLHRILRIVFHCSVGKMIRAYAERIVAVMKCQQERPVESGQHGKREPMSAPLRSPVSFLRSLKYGVSVVTNRSLPNPAVSDFGIARWLGFLLIHLRPEPRYVGFMDIDCTTTI